MRTCGFKFTPLRAADAAMSGYIAHATGMGRERESHVTAGIWGSRLGAAARAAHLRAAPSGSRLQDGSPSVVPTFRSWIPAPPLPGSGRLAIEVCGCSRLRVPMLRNWLISWAASALSFVERQPQ
jgi:hypothetical protein